MYAIALRTSAMDGACSGIRDRGRPFRRESTPAMCGSTPSSGKYHGAGRSVLPRLFSKTRLENFLLSASYNNVFWQVEDFSVLKLCPARLSFVKLANKIQEC